MAACATCKGSGEVVKKEVIVHIPLVGLKKLYDVREACPACTGGK